MKFQAVTRDQIPATRTREGKVSTALVKGFLDSGLELVQVDVSDQDKKMESIRSTVSNYVKRHELPVKVFTAGGNLYLELSEEAKAKYVRENAEAKAAQSNGNATAPESAPEAEAEANA